MVHFNKIVTVLFHPILLPILATLFFFQTHNTGIHFRTESKIILIVAIGTFFVPMIIIYILKKRKLIDNLRMSKISERRIPVICMIILFFTIGKSFYEIYYLIYLSQLFLGGSIALIICLILFNQELKISLHMIGISSFIGFVISMSYLNEQNIIGIIAIAFLLAGIIANARLKLKEHNLKEVLLGFTTGIICQFISLGTILLN